MQCNLGYRGTINPLQFKVITSECYFKHYLTQILQHVDELLSNDCVNNDRCWVMVVNINTGIIFSTWSELQPRDATTEYMLGVFSMQSVPRCYKQDKSSV